MTDIITINYPWESHKIQLYPKQNPGFWGVFNVRGKGSYIITTSNYLTFPWTWNSQAQRPQKLVRIHFPERTALVCVRPMVPGAAILGESDKSGH